MTRKTQNLKPDTVLKNYWNDNGQFADYNALAREGEVNMCTLFEKFEKEGEIKGKAEGIAEGKAEGIAEGKAEGIIETGLDLGLSETDVLQRLQTKLNVSLQKAQEYFEMFGRQTV